MQWPPLKSMTLWLASILLLAAFFQNCGSPFKLNDSRLRLHESGNGGGYAGPNTVFPLIPAIDPTETMSTSDLQVKLNQAQMRCLIGAPERGLTGPMAKLQKIVTNRKHLPCELLSSGDFSALKDFYGYTYDYTTDPQLKSYCEQDYPQFLFQQANSLVQNNDQLIQLGTVQFGPYDETTDPPTLANDPEWTNPKFRFWVNDENYEPLQHFSAAGIFPMAMYATDYDPDLPINVNTKQIQLVFSDFVSENLPLIDTLAKQNSGASFNTFEYMSCVQGEFYFAQDTTVESAKPIPIAYPAEFKKNALCPILDPWIDALNARQSFQMSRNLFGSEFQSVFQTWDHEYQVRKEVAERIFENYLTGKINLVHINTCLSQSPHRADFLYTLQSVFFFKTVEKLKAENNPQLTDFLNILTGSTNGSVWTMFYVSGMGGETTDTKAGVHREKLSTFMNLLRIPKDDWFTVFVHEMSHRLDTVMFESSDRFVKAETLDAVQTELQSETPDQPFLRSWIIDGLQRGLLAEYRAWSLSLQIYESLLNKKSIKPSPWIEEFLSGHRPSEADFNCHLLKTLSQQELISTMPEFSDPKIKALTADILNEVRSCKTEYLQL